MLFADLKGSHGAARRPRSRGGPATPRSGARAHDGGGAPLRGHGQPGHGRRHHGAVRRAAGPRGSRRARVLRRAARCRTRSRRVRRARCGAAHGVALQIRVGLNSGEVVVRAIGNDLHMDYTAVGQTTHLAARMEQIATPGAMLLTATRCARRGLRRRSKPLGPVPVKGLAEPDRGVRADRRRARRARGCRRAAARGLTRFVGRDAELEHARGARWSRPRQGHGQVVARRRRAGRRQVAAVLGVHPLAPHRRAGSSSRAARCPTARPPPTCPSSTCCKAYFQIEDRDDARQHPREGDGQAADPRRGACEPSLPPLLALLDVPVDGPPVAGARPAAAPPAHAGGGQAPAAPRRARCSRCCWSSRTCTGSTPRPRRCSTAWSRACRRRGMLLLVNYRPEYQHGWGSKTYYRSSGSTRCRRESAEELLRALLGDDAEPRAAQARC